MKAQIMIICVIKQQKYVITIDLDLRELKIFGKE